LNEKFKDGDVVQPEQLKAAGLIGGKRGFEVKVLASGELSKAMTVHTHAISGAARKSIESAGGSVVLIGG